MTGSIATARIAVDTHRDRVRGCLLGGAVGDALGAPVEFMSHSDILRHFGPAGITDYAPAFGGLGRITDDTQMTLFTAEGLLRAWVRGCFKGESSVPEVTRLAYLRWLDTQRESPGTGHPDGWLAKHPELHSRRAPGFTCLNALREESAANDSKGCGGVMRVAPVGLFLWLPEAPQTPRHAFKLAAEIAGLTHGHPTGQLSAGVLAALVLMLAAGIDLRDALASARAMLARYPGHEETLRAILHAEELAGADLAHDAAVSMLGQGWVADEALAIAIYCALVAGSFREAVILAVNHDGDSDSTGSITGNLVGAMWGASAIPRAWLEPLELRAVIMEIADDLCDYRNWDIGEHSQDAALNQRVWDKYPGG